jgi:hypothetical protein
MRPSLSPAVIPAPPPVIPAQAGIQRLRTHARKSLGPGLRRRDGRLARLTSATEHPHP